MGFLYYVLLAILIILVIILIYMLVKNTNNTHTCISSRVYEEPRQNIDPDIIWRTIRLINREQLNRFFINVLNNAIPDIEIEINNMDDGDPQNVHDENINEKYKEKILHLIKLNGDWYSRNQEEIIQQTVLEILHKSNNNENVSKVIAKMMEGSYININNTNYKENRILAEVWYRAHSADNNEKEELLEESVINHLIDCVDEYNIIQCLTGRIHRTIDSLVHLDSDDILNSPVPTVAILRNEVNSKINQLLQRELDANAELAKKFNSGEDGVEIEELKKKLFRQVDEYLSEYNLNEKTHKELLNYVNEAF